MTSLANKIVEQEKQDEDIIATLPRARGLGLSGNNLLDYQGFWYEQIFLQGILSLQQNFKPQDSDIIIGSFPKSGTTWLKALTYAITTRTTLNNGHSKAKNNPLLTNMPHDCVPQLEVEVPKNPLAFKDDSGIPLVGTHTPFNSLPKSVLDSGCKIVYICRDPKDVFVSSFHFFSKCDLGIEVLPLEDAFELFCNGFSTFGPYWDHVLGYWKASLELPTRILFLKYEEMKKDTQVHVKRLAEFVGHPFSAEEERNGVLQGIINMCSFDNLSNLEVNRNGILLVDASLEIQNNTFFRKGTVGDWKNYLTAEMGERLDFITEKKLGDSGLKFVSYM